MISERRGAGVGVGVGVVVVVGVGVGVGVVVVVAVGVVVAVVVGVGVVVVVGGAVAVGVGVAVGVVVVVVVGVGVEGRIALMGRSSERRAAEFAAAVVAERARQDAKWGTRADHSLSFWLTILLEEVGECARAVLEKDHANLARELVQVAAVCQRIYEASDSLYGVTLAVEPDDGAEGDLTPEVAKASAWCFGFGTSLCPEARHVATGALANAQGWTHVGARWRCPSCQVSLRDSICPAEALKAPAVCGGGLVSKPCPDGREMATGAEAGDSGWRWERGAWMCPDCYEEAPF